MAVQDTFSQSARPLPRLELGLIGTPRKALPFLFAVAFTSSTFLISFPSYSTLRPAPQVENPKNCYKGTFFQSARPLARVGFGGANLFLEVFFLLFPSVSTSFAYSNSFPNYSTSYWPPQ